MLCQQQSGGNMAVFDRQMKGGIYIVTVIIGVGPAQQQSLNGSGIPLTGAGRQQRPPVPGKGQHYWSGRVRLFIQCLYNSMLYRAAETVAQPGGDAVGVKQVAARTHGG